MASADHKTQQIAAIARKATPGLDRINRLQAIAIWLDADGDPQGARDVQHIIDTWDKIRQVDGRPTAPKMGGMDRPGI